MNILQLQYFMTLAEELSFSKAAEKLFVTQPNVSMQISALEKEWGVQLFFRKYRSVSLTPAGKIMYKTIEEAAFLFNAGLEKAQRDNGKERIPVSIGLPESIHLDNLEEILAKFQREHPQYRLNVESCPQAQLLLLTANGRFDLVLNQLFMLENAKELFVRNFSKSHFTIIISKEHPLADGVTDFTPDLLSGQDINVYIPTCRNSARLVEHCRHICKSCGFTPTEVILTPNVNSALIAAKMCLGISVLDETIVNPNSSNLLFIRTPVTTDMVIAWRRDSEKDCLKELAGLLCDAEAAQQEKQTSPSV